MGRKKRKAETQQRVVVDCSKEESRVEEADTSNLQKIVKKIMAALQAGVPEMSTATAALVTQKLWRPDADGRMEHTGEMWNEVISILANAGFGNGRVAAEKVCEQFKGLLSKTADQTLVSYDEQVLVTRVKSAGKKKALEQKAQKSGARAEERKSPVSLGIALSLHKRMPKPRSMSTVDDLVWSEAQSTAQKQLSDEFAEKSTWEEYYTGMCKVGKALLAVEIHKRTQLIYDYRASKIFSKKQKRSNRSNTH